MIEWHNTPSEDVIACLTRIPAKAAKHMPMFGYSNARLVRVGPVPRNDFDLRMKHGEAELHHAVEVGKDLLTNPFRRH